MWHCQHRNSGTFTPDGAEAASPSRALQSARARSCSRARGADEIPAQLSLLTSVGQQLLPRCPQLSSPCAAQGGCRAGPAWLHPLCPHSCVPSPPDMGQGQQTGGLCRGLRLGRGCSQSWELCRCPRAFLASVPAAAGQVQVFGTWALEQRGLQGQGAKPFPVWHLDEFQKWYPVVLCFSQCLSAQEEFLPGKMVRL